MAISKVTSGGIADGTLSVEDIADDAVTAAKLANSINTDIATGVTGNTTANAALPKAGGTMTGAIDFGDNVKANFGASDDLKIYHDGSNSYISDTGSGNLKIKSGAGFDLQTTTGENYLDAVENAAINLYYDNSKKLATTATGIDVTGSVTADGTIKSTIAGNITSGGNIQLGLVTDDVTKYTNISSTQYDSGSEGEGFSLVGGYSWNASNNRVIIGGGLGEINSSTEVLFFTAANSSTRGGSERMRINSSGNVGIGTSSPAYKLDVSGGHIAIDTLAKGLLGYDGTADRYLVRYISGGDMEIGDSGSSNDIVFKNSGNVGIGTTAPAEKLSVNGSIQSLANNDINYSTQFISRYDSTHGLSITSRLNDSSATEVFGVYANAGGASPRTVINANTGWNFGVGTTSPFSKLHVGTRGTASALTYSSAGDGIVFDFYNVGNPYTRYAKMISASSDTSESRFGLWTQAASGTSSEKLTILGNGNVGIGTTAPSSKLHINNTAGNDGLRITNSTTGEGYIVFGDTADSNTGSIAYNHASDAMTFDVNNSERMRIDSSGKISIGTTSADAQATIQNTSADGKQLRLLGSAAPQQGNAMKYFFLKYIPKVSAGSKLRIPFHSQGNLNVHTICKAMGHDTSYNQSNPKGFSVTFAVGHLSALYNLSAWNGGGNYSSITTSGMFVEITFSSAYSTGLFLSLEYMPCMTGAYSIDEENIVLN